ncbi:MAG TPA: SMC-Scp complex subunit ScpB [Phycisphaerales bacterium]|nr:SMC-Scp complex subunit ScpB [Phycisphaerales bacterium]
MPEGTHAAETATQEIEQPATSDAAPATEMPVAEVPAPVATPVAPKRSRRKAADPTAPVTVDMALAPHLEALLISLDRPTPAERLAVGLGLLPAPEGDDAPPPDKALVAIADQQIEMLVAELNKQFEATSRSFRVELLAGGYRVMTLPAFAQTLATFHKRQTSAKLSRPAVETLAIIAYKQPITRAELESIRGVSCGEVLKTLLEKRLVTIKGRAEELGRPMLYGTTTQFLNHFGLASIKDLPAPTELKLST